VRHSQTCKLHLGGC